MTSYTIDADNNITAHAELPAGADQAFASEKELAKLSADWPASRLVDTWNNFAGVVPFDDLKPVTKFRDRKAATERIWKAVQRLTAAVAPTLAQEGPKKARAKKSPAKGGGRAKAQKGGTGAPREGSKKAEVLGLLGRKQGASLAEIMEATGWQPHTVRGFISIVSKKEGIAIESSKNEAGDRVYRITK
jgi:hypothetical protein